MEIIKEVALKFVEWTKLKIRIHFSELNLYFGEKEIWWASLGANIGYEQDGKSGKYERPILILKKFNRYIFWGIPLTTKIKDNKYYYKFVKGGKEYCAILSQLRVLSSNRLLRKIGMFPDEDFKIVKEQIASYLK